jgi:hypothetical protein
VSPEPRDQPSPEERRLDCALVNPCLSHVTASGWRGFACGGGCGSYRKATAEEFRAEIEGLADLYTVAWNQHRREGASTAEAG